MRRVPSGIHSRNYCSKKCQAIKTREHVGYSQRYAGYRADLGHSVRSRWEANVCRMLKFLHIGYAYEPETFEIGLRQYTPDIRTEQGYWIEVKGYLYPRGQTAIEAFRRCYPNQRLVVLDETMYRQLTEEFSDRIPGWE